MTERELYLMIKMALVKADNMSQARAADLIGVERGNFGRKLRAGTLRAVEVVNLLHALGYKVQAVKDGDKIDL